MCDENHYAHHVMHQTISACEIYAVISEQRQYSSLINRLIKMMPYETRGGLKLVQPKVKLLVWTEYVLLPGCKDMECRTRSRKYII